jgi:hypothetical protein
MPKLIAQSGHSLDLPHRRVIFGESGSCDIPLAAGIGIAPEHFSIAPDAEGNCILTDLSEGLGILVNGQAVEECIIEHGDVISVGGLRLGFWNADAPVRESSPVLAGGSPPEVAPTMMPSSEVLPERLEPLIVEAVQPMLAAEPEPEPSPLIIPSVHEEIPAVEPLSLAEAAPFDASTIVAFEPLPTVESTPHAPEVLSTPTFVQEEAWLNPAQLLEPVPVSSYSGPTANADGGTTSPAKSEGEGVPLSLDRKKRRVRIPVVKTLITLGAAAAVAAIAGFAWKEPWLRQRIESSIAQARAWTTPVRSENPKRPVSKTFTKGKTQPVAAPQAPVDSGPVLPQADHNEVVKRLLTERTLQVFYADLRQLIPFYTSSAGQQELPPRREMAQSFYKHYGISFEGFEQVTCLRGATSEDCVFVFTAPRPITLEAALGIPSDPKTASSPETAPAKSGKAFRIHQIKTPGRTLGAALYDPYTIVLGRPTWIDSALNSHNGPSLREATCMFPETAHREPGALIIVERVPKPKDASAQIVFDTVTTNLFLGSQGSSRLILSRNPDVSEAAFAEHSPAALRQQVDTLIKASAAERSRDLIGKKASAVSVPQSDETQNISLNEGSMVIPTGDVLIQDAIHAMARSFMGRSPAIDLILAAQRAAVYFNMARYSQAEEALEAEGVGAALELLQSGITGGGRLKNRTFKIDAMDSAKMEELQKLLVFDATFGLIYRPDASQVQGSMLDLSITARNYRNAELLISLSKEAPLPSESGRVASEVIRDLLAWADRDGAAKRSFVGLPKLTNEEIEGSAALLGVSEGKLGWRTGEEGYRAWLRRMNPDPKGDAKRIAATFNSALREGKLKPFADADLRQALHVISESSILKSGSAGLSRPQILAAGRYLKLANGTLQVVER